jgi:predicted XRE-type DNA-binding protein
MANLRSKRAIAIAAATVVAAGGAGAAVAATSNGTRPSDFLDSVARHLGVSRQKLDDATKAAAIDQVNADLAAGRITKSQADELKKRIEAGDVPALGYGRGFGGGGPGIPPIAGGGPGLIKPFIDGGLAAAAKYLGLSESDLRTKLGNGQSLADVAKAQNKDVSGLEDAIVAAEQAQLDKAVADKTLTQSQADEALSSLKSRVDDIVNGQLRFGGHGGPGGPGGPGFGFRFGFGSGDALSAAAKYLGLSESDLRTKLGSKQSLADVAKAQNKDVSGLEDALVAATKAQLDKAVAAKKLTQSQADDALSAFKSHVDDLVNAKQPDRPRFEQRGAGPRFFFGP